jgi:hypothetical protein
MMIVLYCRKRNIGVLGIVVSCLQYTWIERGGVLFGGYKKDPAKFEKYLVTITSNWTTN